jgi:hypothetical protein
MIALLSFQFLLRLKNIFYFKFVVGKKLQSKNEASFGSHTALLAGRCNFTNLCGGKLIKGCKH